MKALVVPLGVVGLIAVLYLLFIFADLSQRLGAVTKMKPHYRWFWIASGFLSVSILARVMRSSQTLALETEGTAGNVPLFYLVIYYLPFVIAMTISVGIAWRYWNWLFKERLS